MSWSITSFTEYILRPRRYVPAHDVILVIARQVAPPEKTDSPQNTVRSSLKLSSTVNCHLKSQIQCTQFAPLKRNVHIYRIQLQIMHPLITFYRYGKLQKSLYAKFNKCFACYPVQKRREMVLLDV